MLEVRDAASIILLDEISMHRSQQETGPECVEQRAGRPLISLNEGKAYYNPNKCGRTIVNVGPWP